jgi:hypothetical protein
MGSKKHSAEEIIGKLREAEIMQAQGGAVADACRRIGLRSRPFSGGARSLAV